MSPNLRFIDQKNPFHLEPLDLGNRVGKKPKLMQAILQASFLEIECLPPESLLNKYAPVDKTYEKNAVSTKLSKSLSKNSYADESELHACQLEGHLEKEELEDSYSDSIDDESSDEALLQEEINNISLTSCDVELDSIPKHHLPTIFRTTSCKKLSIYELTEKCSFFAARLGQKNYQQMCELISVNGLDYFNKVKELRKSQEACIGSNRILFTLSQEIFAYVRELGNGKSKITYELLLIGNKDQILLQEENSKIRSFSLSRLTVPDKENQEERKINIFLQQQSKISDLSLVNVAESIHVVNDNQLGIMAIVCQGDIDKLLEKFEVGETERKKIVYLMARAVGQLHKINVIHRDIKPDNFLYQLNHQKQIEVIKITDFGSSTRIEKKERSTINKFFIHSSDPTIFDSQLKKVHSETKYSKTFDIYQLGITIWQTLLGYSMTKWKVVQDRDQEAFAVRAFNVPSENKWIEWKKHPEEWVSIHLLKDCSVQNIIKRMVDPDPIKRPLIEEVIDFFDDYYQGDISNKDEIKLVHPH